VSDPAIIVVSGLPRSGTSLAMQMLRAGGVPVVSDGQRVPDDDNPRGYFEDARTLRLWDDASWLDAAVGKAIKIVAPLLPALPFEYDFRVVLMERELSEVMASQATMLRRQVGDDRRLAAFGQLVQTLTWFKRWVRYQPNFRCLAVPYRDLVEAPADQVARIAGFLECDLDCDAMARAVDPSLHRQRA
jgi:hypothetical protein